MNEIVVGNECCCLKLCGLYIIYIVCLRECLITAVFSKVAPFPCTCCFASALILIFRKVEVYTKPKSMK